MCFIFILVYVLKLCKLRMRERKLHEVLYITSNLLVLFIKHESFTFHTNEAVRPPLFDLPTYLPNN